MEPAPLDPSVRITEAAATWTPSPDEDRTMGKYERRIFLDRLVELRQAYQRTAHEATTLTADAAIDYVAALFDDTDRLEAILAEDSADTTSTSDSPV
jgi:hypothetical protein